MTRVQEGATIGNRVSILRMSHEDMINEILELENGGEKSGEESDTCFAWNLDDNIRALDVEKDIDFINRVKEMRKNIPRSLRGKYNFAYAEVNVEGLDKSKFYAHSAIKDTNSIEDVKHKKNLKDISIQPLEEDKIFDTLIVNENNVVGGVGAWDRVRDAEFKIFNEIANKLGDNKSASGTIKLYTDLDCCPSCRNVINQFKRKYANIDIEIIYKTKGGNQ